MDRAVSEDCQPASAALLHSVNPLPFITRSARLNPLPRAARCKSPLGCLLIAHEVGRKHTLPLQNHIPTDRTYPQGLDCRHAYGRDQIPSDLHRQDNRRNIGRPFLLLHISIHSILQIQNRMHSIQIQERPEPQNTIIRPT